MSYYPTTSPLVCIFNNIGHVEGALTSYAEFTTSLFEGYIDSSDNTVLKSPFPLTISGDLRYTFSGSGGLRSLAYFEIDGTDTSYKGSNRTGGASGSLGISPEIFFVKTESNQEIKLELKKASGVGTTYTTDYSRVIGVVK